MANRRSPLSRMLSVADPESAHAMALGTYAGLARNPLFSSTLKRSYTIKDSRLSQNILGRTFDNPVGLAAGFDKNGRFIRAAHMMGFGFIEIGGITPLPQKGNKKPRLFRFPVNESLQNAMGFNNDGVDRIRERVEKLYPYHIPIGVNVGKSAKTSNEKAINDYIEVIEGFNNLCDYFVVNVSSPNTPGLVELQNEQFVQDVFHYARRVTKLPVMLKISPDLKPSDAIYLCKAAVDSGASGIIATNTSTDYGILPNAKSFGGISGKALRDKSFLLFKAVSRELFGRTKLISVGGVDSGAEAFRRITHGASLVQLYTSLVYRGPAIAREINKELLEIIDAGNGTSIKDQIGTALS